MQLKVAYMELTEFVIDSREGAVQVLENASIQALCE